MLFHRCRTIVRPPDSPTPCGRYRRARFHPAAGGWLIRIANLPGPGPLQDVATHHGQPSIGPAMLRRGVPARGQRIRMTRRYEVLARRQSWRVSHR